MAWARISDDFHDHAKVAELTVDLEGLAALGLWTLALSWVRADRRRKGIVPIGIAARLAAGNVKQLASRLVGERLWVEVPGGWRFHDFEDIYEPAGLVEKRAAAGRMGGVASGKSRRERPKQSASDAKQSASFASRAAPAEPPENMDEWGQDADDPREANPDLLRGDLGETGRFASRSKTDIDANHLAPDQGKRSNLKQSASKREAKRLEASRARAGSTTHYPDASYEASTPLGPPEGGTTEPARTKRDRGHRIPDDFAVTPEMVTWAREKTPTVDGRLETEKFINYWQSKPGAGATKLDWVKTWKNWMLTAAERAPSNVVAIRAPTNGRKPSTADQRMADAIALANHFAELDGEAQP